MDEIGYDSAIAYPGNLYRNYKQARALAGAAFTAGSYVAKRFKQSFEEEPTTLQTAPVKSYFMPKGKSYYKKKYRAKYKGKYKKRYGGYAVARQQMPPKMQKTFVNTGMGFPKQLKMTHRYTVSGTLVCTTGNVNAASFTINSLNNPDGLSAKSPMYYAAMGALYNRYCVIGAKASIKFVPDNSVVTPARYGVMIIDDAGVTPTTIDDFCSSTSASWKTWNTYSPANENVISKKWSAKKAYGGAVMSNVNLGADYGANPAQTSYITVFAAPVDAATTVTYRYTMEITFIAIWTEVKDVNLP